MANDLIDRNRLLGDLYAEWLLCAPDTPTFINGELQRSEKAKLIEAGMKLVQNQPVVESKPAVYAKWTLHDDGSGTCSHCKRRSLLVWDVDNHARFCQHCGAEMNGTKGEHHG